jgi:DNA-binding XRE family transcriptional regulator
MHPQTAAPLLTIRAEFKRTLQLERAAFAAKVRVARAVLAMSQDEFARHTGLTQKSVHRIEQGAVEPKLRTVYAIERFWASHGISFEEARDGGFSLNVEPQALRD